MAVSLPAFLPSHLLLVQENTAQPNQSFALTAFSSFNSRALSSVTSACSAATRGASGTSASSAISKMASISTEIELGSDPMPTAERAPLPASPKMSDSRLANPSMTDGCAPKLASALTYHDRRTPMTAAVAQSSDQRHSWLFIQLVLMHSAILVVISATQRTIPRDLTTCFTLSRLPTAERQ